MSGRACSHLDEVEVRQLPREVEGCEDCLASGGKWLHLRICLTCGHVGCCDSSNGHATAHARASGHAIIRSLPISEQSFTWCYECDRYV